MGSSHQSSLEKMDPMSAIMDDKDPTRDSMLTKIKSKSRENPLVPLGILGSIGAVAYGFYNFKNRGNKSASMYIMEMRVTAQSFVVGAMALTVAYHLFKDYVIKPRETKKKD